MVRAILACIGTVALAACADPAHQVPAAQPEAQAMRNLAPRPPGRYPVGPEVLVFQNYGRTIASRVSSDPNFGGFIFKSEPEPHAIVMFTGNAEARLRRYTRDPRFKAKRVDITLAELEEMKSRTSQEMRVPGAQCLSVDADEEHNTVTVSGPLHELEMVRAAIADGRFRPPPKFRLVAGSCAVAR
jgi:hypothetical protein